MLRFRSGACVAVVLIGLFGLSGCGTFGLIKADMMLDMGKYEETIPLYKQYLEKYPDSATAMSHLGFAYLKTGRLDEAISMFQEALEKEPGEPYAVLYLGIAYLNKEEYDKTLNVWQGYQNKEKPLVEEEIKRLMTLVKIAKSHQEARKALAAEKSLQTTKPESNTVAVCYYQDHTADNRLKGFQKGLAAMVITDMAKIRSIKVVERARLQALLQEMKLGQTGIVDAKTAPRVGRLLGVETLVVGGLASGIDVTTTLASTSREKIVGTTNATIPQKAFFEIPKGIVLEAAKIMKIDLTPEEMEAIGIPHTKSYKAVSYYGLALDALDAGKWKEAKDLFGRALMEDPMFDLAAEGNASCPSAASPSVSQLQQMSVSQLSSSVEQSVAVAKSAQEAADAAADTADRGGGGGGGH